MVKSLESEINTALWDEAVLEAGNEIVRSMPVKQIHGALTYNVIHQGLTADLCATLTRIYDFGTKRYRPNERETSSIPLLMKLVRQKRCVDFYIQKARIWNKAYQSLTGDPRDCENAFEIAIVTYRQLMTGGGPSKLKRAKAFRNYRPSHRKIDDITKGFPVYNDLFSLTEPAAIIIENLRLATSGMNLSLTQQKQGMAEEARNFWSRALHAISN